MSMTKATLLAADEARHLAADHAAAKGWPFSDPVEVRRRRGLLSWGAGCWIVTSNADARGSNVRVEIDARSGVVVASAFNPR